MKRLLIMVFSLTLGLTGVGAFAQTEKEGHLVSLEGLLKEAQSNNWDIKAARFEWEAAKKRVPQASALPDPSAGYAFMGPMLETLTGPQKNVYSVEQMIPFPGKLYERRQAAYADVKGSEAKFHAIKKDVDLKVAETYYDLLAVDQSIILVEQILELLKDLERSSEAKYASKNIEQSEVIRIQSESSEALNRLLMLKQQKDTLQAFMRSLLNRDFSLEPATWPEPPLPKDVPSLEQFLSDGESARPELKIAQAGLEKADRMKDLARMDNAPDIKIGFQYTEIGNGTTHDPHDGRDAWMIPVTITIPLWQNRIGSEIQEARHNYHQAQAKLDQENNESGYVIKSAYYRFSTARQTLALYKNALVPQTEMVFHALQSGYEAGLKPITDLIISERDYLNTKIAYHLANAEALKAFDGLQRAVGRSILDFSQESYQQESGHVQE